MRWNDGKGCRKSERQQEKARVRVWFDDNKSGKYKYAIFINECALQCQCTHNVYVWFIILSCGFFIPKKTFVIYAPKAQIHTDVSETHRVREKERRCEQMAFGFP